MIDGIGASAPPTPADGASAGPVTVEKDAFLKLLVAQISNQDPLAPQDSDQYMQQITQFSTLEQLMNVNAGIANLSVGQVSANSQQALRFIGKAVVASGDTLDLEAGGTPSVTWRAHDAKTVKVVVSDEAGNPVRTAEVPAEPGLSSWTWDGVTDEGGTAPPGRYRVHIEATDAEGHPVGVDTFVRGVVTGVRFDNGYPELLVGDRRLRLSDIVEVGG